MMTKYPAFGQKPTQTPRVSVTYRAVDHLKPDAANPRRHSHKQIQQIANSIEAFGFNVPILVDNDLKVIAGHGRLLAARKLGWSEVPTISIGHLSEAQARAFMIADNRLTELSSWDPKMLAVELKALSVVDLDFSLEATGFEVAEIDLRIGALDAESAPEPDAADMVPAVAPGPPVSNMGDLWRLGDHRSNAPMRSNFGAPTTRAIRIAALGRWSSLSLPSRHRALARLVQVAALPALGRVLSDCAVRGEVGLRLFMKNMWLVHECFADQPLYRGNKVTQPHRFHQRFMA
jgi:hypothetical protein